MEETLERLLNFFVIEDESGVSNPDNSSTSRILLLFTPASISILFYDNPASISFAADSLNHTEFLKSGQFRARH